MNLHPKKYTGTVNLLRDSLLELSEFLKTKVKFEKQANQNNFDSGIPIEDFFRDTIQKVIPPKYSITSGTIIDRNNNTCGDCDVVFYDSFSYPNLKLPSTDNSRRKFLSFESIYGIIEIKQSLNLGALTSNGKLKDNTKTNLVVACEKIAQFKALERKKSNDVNATSGLAGKSSRYRNRPFGYILCMDGPDDWKAAQKEIRKINKEIPKELRIDGLFILDKYSFSWFSTNPNSLVKEIRDVNLTDKFAEQFNQVLDSNVTEVAPEDANGDGIIFSGENTLYYLFTLLWNNLSTQTLSAPDFYFDYGGRESLRHKVALFFPSK